MKTAVKKIKAPRVHGTALPLGNAALFPWLKKYLSATPIIKYGRRNPIRLWVPVCADGQSVYSWLVLLSELFLEDRVRVFATDENEQSIRKARRGNYSEAEMKSVFITQRSRFFQKMPDSRHQFRRSSRNQCTFALHSVFQDPPICRLDFIDARNVPMKSDPLSEARLLSSFHFALKNGGVLILSRTYSSSLLKDYFNMKYEKLGVFLKKDSWAPHQLGASRVPVGKNRLITQERRGKVLQEDGALEELTSLNEELKLRNEELDIVREETLVLNEELKAVNNEITKRNEKLDKLNIELLNLLESMDLPVIILNKKFQIQRFNDAASGLFNLIDTDIGRKISDIRHNIEIPDLQTQFDRILNGTQTITYEVRDNKNHWYTIRYRPFFSSKRNVDGVIITFSDVHALRTNRDTLEKLVIARSEELIKAKEDVQMNKRLADIGMLAATVAHELRSPLAAINMAAANIKRKSPDSPHLDHHIDSIGKKVLESDQIIRNLLYYSRIKPPFVDQVNVYDILEECLAQLKDRRGRKEEEEEEEEDKVKIIRSMDCLKDKTIEADPLQIRELLTNILNNAQDALKNTSGVLEVRGSCDKESIEISVKDNGIGISEKELTHVFNPFFTTKAKGTGLGLTVCQQIVYLHKGSINIKSRPGEGTTVTITLPIRKAKQTNRLPTEQDEEPFGSRTASASRIRRAESRGHNKNISK